MQVLVSVPWPRPPMVGAAVLVLLAGCAPSEERRVFGANAGGIHLDGGDDDDDDDDDPAMTTGIDPGDAGGDDDGGDTGHVPPSVDDGADDGGESSGGVPDHQPPASPYAGGWDIGDCQDQIVASGTNVGQVVPDFQLTDQFGEQVRLYDFCHKAVFLVAGAFW